MKSHGAAILLLILAVLALPALAAPAGAVAKQEPALSVHLVKDIDTQPADWAPSAFTQVGTEILFSAMTSSQQPLLWETRGDVATTHLLTHDGHTFANPFILGTSGGFGYFSTVDGRGGADLWKTNGSSVGTVRLRDIRPHIVGDTGAPYNFVSAGGRAYFLVGGQTGDQALWETAGTTSSTRQVAGVNPGSGQFGMGLFEQMAAIGGEVFFTSTTPDAGTELWKSDGTAAGTVIVKDIYPGLAGSYPQDLTVVGGELFFTAVDGKHGRELWKTDGTAAGTTMVRNLAPDSPGHVQGSNISALVPAGARLYFVADPCPRADSSCPYGPAPLRHQLFVTDGTPSGTHMVKRIASPDSVDVDTSAMAWLPTGPNGKGLLLFDVNAGRRKDQVWRTDGTATGTFEVKDINPTSLAYPQEFTPLRIGKTWQIVFIANDGTHGMELWRSNGTSQGTRLVKDINPGPAGSFPQYLTPVELLHGRAVMFQADGGQAGSQLWTSNGTTSGTRRIGVNVDQNNGSCPTALTPFPGGLFFTASNRQMLPSCSPFALFSPDENQLYEAGNQTRAARLVYQGQGPVKSPTAHGGDGSEGVYPLLSHAGYLYFESEERGKSGKFLGFQLRRIANGGSGRSASQLIDTFAPASGGILAATWFRNRLVLLAGKELLSTTGSSNRLQVLASTAGEISGISDNLPFVAFHNRLYFAVSQGPGQAWHIWSTNGEPGTSRQLGNITLDTSGAFTPDLTVDGSHMVFLAHGGQNQAALWMTDGSRAGSRLLHTFPVLQTNFASDIGGFTLLDGAVYFSGSDLRHGYELWRTTLTPGSTTLVRDIAAGSDSSSVFDMTAFDGMLWFRATDGVHGDELWNSDGTSGGTKMVRDFDPSEDAHTWGVGYLTPAGRRMFFVADEPGHTGLWMTNGTASGTAPFQGRQPSEPQDLTATGRDVYFTATTPATGEELWVIRPG